MPCGVFVDVSEYREFQFGKRLVHFLYSSFIRICGL